MAERSSKRKRAGRTKADSKESALWTSEQARSERRFEPKAGAAALASVIAMSLGAVAVGAGVYGQWLRDAERGSHPWAVYLLGAGSVVLLGVAVLGQRTPPVIRVGDAGVGREGDGGEITRIAWCDVTRLTLSASALTVESHGRAITVPVDLQGVAAARVLAEARRRIPAKAEDIDPGPLPAVEEGAGELIALEPPQVAGARCHASDKLIAFEKDARVCGRCGAVYHKEHVPNRCTACDASLG